MHETLNDNILGHIDKYEVKEESFTISGWCFHKNIGTLPLRLNYDDIFNHNEDVFKLEKRKDVGDFYKNENVENCGWKINIEIPEISDKFLLEMKINDEWISIFDFLIYDTNKKYIPSFAVVDDFYKYPDKIRDFALKQTFIENPNYHKGKRTDVCYRFPNLKERFETILGHKIKNWTNYRVNCCFQTCIAGDQLVYHVDGQQYAGIIFLTPDAPPEAGTSFYRSKNTKKAKITTDDFDVVFKMGFYDSSQFEVVDVVGNKYNRLVLFDAKMIHAASSYFGNDITNGRLFQMFFFDLEE